MFPVQSDLYNIIVVVDNSSGKIIGAGSLILERKFIRNAGVVCTQFLIFDYFSFNPFFLFFQAGHIEDIVVNDKYRGKKLGLRIIETLNDLGWAN